MSINMKRIYEAIQFAQSVAKVEDDRNNNHSIGNHLANIQVYTQDQLDSEFGCECVVVGNWNDVDRYDAVSQTKVSVSTLPSRLCKVLEKLGAECDWYDTTTTCNCCDKLMVTEPQHYWWKPSYVETNAGSICLECYADM